MYKCYIRDRACETARTSTFVNTNSRRLPRPRSRVYREQVKIIDDCYAWTLWIKSFHSSRSVSSVEFVRFECYQKKLNCVGKFLAYKVSIQSEKFHGADMLRKVENIIMIDVFEMYLPLLETLFTNPIYRLCLHCERD